MSLTTMWNKLCCRIAGHPGVCREWEWLGTRPRWEERTDAWTCIRCQTDIPNPDSTLPRYATNRPHMPMEMVEMINASVDKFGPERVRIRAHGDTYHPR